MRIIEDFFLSFEILEITDHMNLRASGSIPVEGSSKKTIEGLPIEINIILILKLKEIRIR